MAAASVLVVEDSFLVAISLEDVLGDAGHAVTLAGSVAEAEAALATQDFVAALLDFKLPDGNALQLARKLAATGCAVAVVSGMDRDAVPEDPAIIAHFAKPIEDSVLAQWVADMVALRT